MKRLQRILGAVVLAVALATPAGAQAPRVDSWDNQWYWGVGGGAFRYATVLQPAYYDPILGAHWFITSKRIALYMAYEQAWFLVDAATVIADPASSGSSVGPGFRDVTFSDMRRIMFGLVALPRRAALEPYFGGGFAMMQVLNPVVDCSTCLTQAEAFQAQDLAEDASSKAFGFAMAGGQYNRGKLTVFGNVIVTSAATGFLIDGTTTSVEFGLRYSFGTSKEAIIER
jgi:opacity protein-like surface antigen